VTHHTRTRLIETLLALVMGTGCAARGPSPPPHKPPADQHVWTLDRQPIPTTLEEAINALQRGLGKPTIARLRTAEEDIAITLVPTLGRWMQDHWGLATGGPLAQYFESLGLGRPDDMAAVILTSLWRTLHFRQIRLEEQVAWYKATRK
jgi:hypothetical protein